MHCARQVEAVGVERVARRLLEELLYSGPVEALEPDSPSAGHAAQVGQRRGEVVVAIEIRVAVCADDRDVGKVGGQHASRQLQRAPVDPVHVVDHDHE